MDPGIDDVGVEFIFENVGNISGLVSDEIGDTELGQGRDAAAKGDLDEIGGKIVDAVGCAEDEEIVSHIGE